MLWLSPRSAPDALAAGAPLLSAPMQRLTRRMA